MLPVLVAWAVVVAAGAAAAGGRSRVTMAVVPPVASAALSTAAASTVPTPRLRPRVGAGATLTGCTEKLADGADEKAGRSGPAGGVIGPCAAGAGVVRGAGGGAYRGRSLSGAGSAGGNGSVIRDALLRGDADRLSPVNARHLRLA